MILLEITDDSGLTLYEMIGIKPKDLAGVSTKEASVKIRKAAKKSKGIYNKKAQKGNKKAEKKMAKINEAEITLKDVKKREEYDKSLESGNGSTLEVLRTQKLGSPFFNNRNTRFKVIEKLMKESGMVKPISI